MIIKDPEYRIGENVYHVAPNSPKGTVLNIRYDFFAKELEYLVAWTYVETDWYTISELAREKTLEF